LPQTTSLNHQIKAAWAATVMALPAEALWTGRKGRRQHNLTERDLLALAGVRACRAARSCCKGLAAEPSTFNALGGQFSPASRASKRNLGEKKLFERQAARRSPLFGGPAGCWAFDHGRAFGDFGAGDGRAGGGEPTAPSLAVPILALALDAAETGPVSSPRIRVSS